MFAPVRSSPSPCPLPSREREKCRDGSLALSEGWVVDRPEGPSLRFSFPGEAVQKRRGLLRGFGVLRKLRDLRNRPKAGGEGFRNWPKMKIKAKLNSLLVGGSQREGETLCRPQPLVLRRKRTEAYRRPEPIGTERGVTEVLDEYMALTVNGLCSSIATVVAKVTSGTKLGRGISVGARGCRAFPGCAGHMASR